MKHLVTHPHYADGWNRTIVLLIIGFYVFAIAGLFFPSWEGFILAAVLYMISGFGVTVGYHRYFTHDSFETYWPIRWLLAIAGMFSGEGPVIFWVAWHRKHHQASDTPDDPHSPHFGGFLHAHLLWMMAFISPERYKKLYLRYAGKTLIRDRFLSFLNWSYAYWHIGLMSVIALSGYLYGGWYYALSFVGYGYFVRMILVLNATWSVNSLAHLYGSQPLKEYTDDDSRNNLFVAIVALGEGWHHNHHVSPTSYRHGIRWWQLDPSAALIWCMWLVGLAWNLKPFILPPIRGGERT